MIRTLISAACPEDRAGQPGVGTRPDLHSDDTRIRVSDSEPQGTLAPSRHDARKKIIIVDRKLSIPPDTGKTVEVRIVRFSLKICPKDLASENGIDPYRHLTWLFERLPPVKSVDGYDALLPWKMQDELCLGWRVTADHCQPLQAVPTLTSQPPQNRVVIPTRRSNCLLERASCGTPMIHAFTLPPSPDAS